MAAEAARVGFEARILSRSLNVDLSGGERKRNETVQLGVLRPRFAILDEIDSGLDVDALRAVARRVEAATTETSLGVLAITHYTRLLSELRPDFTHVLSGGRIVARGGPELAAELERTGYAGWAGRKTNPGGQVRPGAQGPPLALRPPAIRSATRWRSEGRPGVGWWGRPRRQWRDRPIRRPPQCQRPRPRPPPPHPGVRRRTASPGAEFRAGATRARRWATVAMAI